MSLESTITTAELERRPARAPQFQGESEALIALTRAMRDPQVNVLQSLAEAALRLCRAHSAGVSIEEDAAHGRKVFRWHGAAGRWAPFLNGTMPREASPCGVVLDRRTPLLMARPERHFAYPHADVPPLVEVLLVPFEVAGATVGSVWVIAHDETRRFDREDLRLMKSLSEIAALQFEIHRRTDLLGQAQAEQGRRAAEERLRLVQDAARIGSWDWDLESGELTWSEQCKALFEIAPQEPLTYERFLAAIHEQDRPLVDAAVKASLASGERYAIEMRVPLPNGDVRWIASQGEAHRLAGRPTRMTGMALDISAVKRAEARERVRSAELAALLETVPAAVWITRDREGRMITGNRFAHEILRLPEGANLSKSAPAGERPLHFRVLDDCGRELAPQDLPVQRAARTGLAQHGLRIVLEFDDGARVTLFGNTEPLRSADGEVIGAVAVLLDISQLEAVRSELQLEVQRKDEFLAILAHELRNPMAPIRYASNLLRANASDPTLRRASETIERQAAQMARLLDDLLDVSRITRNAITLKLEWLDLRTSIREAIELARPVIEAEQHRVTVSLPIDEVWVQADAERMLQIVSNVLGNAIKYTEPGGQISVSLLAEPDHALLRIADTGVGFPAEMAPRLFELFSQVKHTEGMSKGGLGIGLAVVRQLVSLHGGEVTAHSDGPGKGAVFSVRLPRVAAPARREDDPGEGEVVPLFRQNLRVLVVEDNADAADSLAMLLRARGVSVSVAHTGADALKVATTLRPGIVVLDIGLPDISGHEVARALRGAAGAGPPAIIAVSGWAQQQDRERSAQSGIDVHLAKPVDPGRLLRIIEDLANGCSPAPAAGSRE